MNRTKSEIIACVLQLAAAFAQYMIKHKPFKKYSAVINKNKKYLLYVVHVTINVQNMFATFALGQSRQNFDILQAKQ